MDSPKNKISYSDIFQRYAFATIVCLIIVFIYYSFIICKKIDEYITKIELINLYGWLTILFAFILILIHICDKETIIYYNGMFIIFIVENCYLILLLLLMKLFEKN